MVGEGVMGGTLRAAILLDTRDRKESSCRARRCALPGNGNDGNPENSPPELVRTRPNGTTRPLPRTADMPVRIPSICTVRPCRSDQLVFHAAHRACRAPENQPCKCCVKSADTFAQRRGRSVRSSPAIVNDNASVTGIHDGSWLLSQYVGWTRLPPTESSSISRRYTTAGTKPSVSVHHR